MIEASLHLRTIFGFVFAGAKGVVLTVPVGGVKKSWLVTQGEWLFPDRYYEEADRLRSRAVKSNY